MSNPVTKLARPRWIAPVLVLGLLAALPAAGPIAHSSANPATQAAPATVAVSYTAPVYSTPSWLPFRTDMRVSCVLSNCMSNGKPNHGYWAMDFVNPYVSLNNRTPVYSTGGGVAHIGGRHNGCRTATSGARGNWVWVDHGGGETSMYYHFSSILVTEGQVVTPATRLGLLGSSGDVAPCTNPYLHYEFHVGGLLGTRTEPGPMRVCSRSRLVTYPQALGYRSWNDAPKLTTIPAGDNASCTTNPARSGHPATTTARRGSLSVKVAWTPTTSNPKLVNRYVIMTRMYHPSVHSWGKWEFRYRSSSARSTSFTGLHRTSTYQFRVASHDPHGYSRWSPRLTAKI